ncbi:MAG: hemerythrin domain-containing protein [bacterium]|nr:hemerythrin domain-containing protein [bacterium]
MNTPTKILAEEHQNILKVIDALLKKCKALESGGGLDKDFFKKAIEFIRGYADKFHHAKEEDILFVELCRDTAQMHCNPTEQMLHEHELGRGYVKNLEKGLAENDKDKIIENARGYSQLLQDHIYKEDNILYPMAEEALSQEIKEAMLDKFKQVEQKFIEENKKYMSLVEELTKKSKNN